MRFMTHEATCGITDPTQQELRACLTFRLGYEEQLLTHNRVVQTISKMTNGFQIAGHNEAATSEVTAISFTQGLELTNDADKHSRQSAAGQITKGL